MKQKIDLEKIIIEIARLVVGATFLFSGFVKAIDPYGFTYKIEDYLIELNLLELFPLALPFAVVMVVAEFALGALLLLGVYRKFTTRLIGLFMIAFTPFTLWVAIANPVEDCGCFGDALIISNWATFYKNVVLLAGIILLIVKWRKITPLFVKWKEHVAALFVVLFGVAFALYNIYQLPVLDFRPYKIGANIPEQMFVDPEKADVMETVFIYSKDGEEQEFTEENYPWDDSTWVFVDMKTRLVKEGEKPAIEDFRIDALYFDMSVGGWRVGGDITDIVLSDTSYTFLAVVYSLEKMNLKYFEKLRDVSEYARYNGYPFYFVTSSSEEVVGQWEVRFQTGFQFAHTDERVLKTMIRSSPGLLLLKEGTVLGKWDDSKINTPENINIPIEESGLIMTDNQKSDTSKKLSVLALLFFVPLLILKFAFKEN